MRKRWGFLVLVAVFALLLPDSMALAGGQGRVQSRGGGKGGGKITGRSAPAAKRVYVRTKQAPKEKNKNFKPASKKTSSLPSGLRQAETIALELQKTRFPGTAYASDRLTPGYQGMGVTGLNQARSHLPQQPPNLEIITNNTTAITISHSIR